MRRRREINVWPAYADLMTVLAVVGLFVAVGLVSSHSGGEDPVQQLQRLTPRIAELERQIVALEEERKAWERERQRLQHEAATNTKMFRAIQEAQGFVDQMARNHRLQFSSDQSLQFGDDLVSFALNSLEPQWTQHGRERLRGFCSALSLDLGRALEDGEGMSDVFSIHVEGHTDLSTCPEDPFCNWRISAGRASAFVAVMRDPDFCPGGRSWNLLPIGYAHTKPAAGYGRATRRIALRIVPDYKRLIERAAQ